MRLERGKVEITRGYVEVKRLGVQSSALSLLIQTGCFSWVLAPKKLPKITRSCLKLPKNCLKSLEKGPSTLPEIA